MRKEYERRNNGMIDAESDVTRNYELHARTNIIEMLLDRDCVEKLTDVSNLHDSSSYERSVTVEVTNHRLTETLQRMSERTYAQSYDITAERGNIFTFRW